MTMADTAAEYLALTIARRTGADPQRLAELTGLDYVQCWDLTRLRDLTEITRRRALLDTYTKGTTQ